MGITIHGHEDTSFAVFSIAFRANRRAHAVDACDRIAAALGALSVCGLVILFAAAPTLSGSDPPAKPFEAVVQLLPSMREKRPSLQAPFVGHLLRPKSEISYPPQLTIQASQNPKKATSPPTEAPLPLQLTEGVASQSNSGTSEGITGAYTSGSNANTIANCFDAVWAAAVSIHAQRFFYYPAEARALHATGLVIVHFTEHRDGSLGKVDVSRSSGVRGLDDAAIDIVRKAQPFPVIPEHMQLDWIDLLLPIDFGVPGLHLNPTAGNCGSGSASRN